MCGAKTLWFNLRHRVKDPRKAVSEFAEHRRRPATGESVSRQAIDSNETSVFPLNSSRHSGYSGLSMQPAVSP